MQYLLARPARLADRLHRWAIRRWFPVLARVAPRWPRWWEQLHARWVIFLIMAIYPRPKRLIRKNLARVLGASEGSWQVRRAGSVMLRHFAFYWVDMFRFAQLPSASASDVFDNIEGSRELGEVLLRHLDAEETPLRLGGGPPQQVTPLAEPHLDLPRPVAGHQQVEVEGEREILESALAGGRGQQQRRPQALARCGSATSGATASSSTRCCAK